MEHLARAPVMEHLATEILAFWSVIRGTLCPGFSHLALQALSRHLWRVLKIWIVLASGLPVPIHVQTRHIQ